MQRDQGSDVSPPNFDAVAEASARSKFAVEESDGLLAENVDYPVRRGEPDDFARVRDFFAAAHFDDKTLCRLLHIEAMNGIGEVDWDRVRLDAVPPSLRWCIETFVRDLPTASVRARSICGDATLDAFLAMRLLRPSRRDPSALITPIWLYPVDGFIVVSDRHNAPDGELFSIRPDVVFPAIDPGALKFLRFLPDAGGGEALDLCGGTGIGALHLSRSARRAASADITPRSAFFADFNARLNGSDVISLCGDLYAPVRHDRFDVITAHPPFVPALGENLIYRDGGELGEEITRRTVEGLPEHLRVGGTCMIQCVARDTHDRLFENRVRDWLGPAAAKFDIVFGMEEPISVGELAERLGKRRKLGAEDRQALTDRFEAAGTRNFVYGVLFVRHCAGIAGDPRRLHLTAETRGADFEAILRWRERARDPGFLGQIAGARTRLAPGAEMTVRSVAAEGKFVPAECTFAVRRGFETVLRLDPWVGHLVTELDGTRSPAEVHARALEAGSIPADFTPQVWFDILRFLLETGLILWDDEGRAPEDPPALEVGR